MKNDLRTKLYVGMHDGVCTLTCSDGGEAWQRGAITPLDHAAARFALCAGAPQRAYLAAYESGVWRTDDGGNTWKRLESYPSAYAHSVAVHPRNPALIYVGSEPAALFRSEDGGMSWEECSSFREVPEAGEWLFHGGRHSHVRDVHMAPDDPHRIYAGIEVGGIVRSRDGGKSWEQLHGTDSDVHSLHISAARPSTVYAATAEGPYRSDDGGDSWEPINSGLERRYTVPIVAAPDNHEHVLVAVASHAGRKGAQAYLSTDAGRKWRRIGLSSEEDMVVVYAWDSSGSDRVYAGTDEGKLFMSSDRGESWEQTRADLPSMAVGAMVAVPDS